MARTNTGPAVFPGTFDPITNGHLDAIRRAAALFDQVVVGVGQNPEKTAMLSQAERTGLAKAVLADLPNVRVQPYAGLTIDFASRLGASLIVRGIRSGTDLRFENDVTMTNRAASGVETVYLVADSGVAFISSALVRQIAVGGGDICSMVPRQVAEAMRKKIGVGGGEPNTENSVE